MYPQNILNGIPNIIRESSNGFSPISIHDDLYQKRFILCTESITKEYIDSLVFQLLQLDRLNHVYSLPLEMLYVNGEKKQSQSVETILLQNFFARRITLSNPKRINQNRRVLSRRIIWNKKNHKDLFQILEIEKSARKIKTIRDKIAVILEYYKSKSLIDDYYIDEDVIEVK